MQEVEVCTLFDRIDAVGRNMNGGGGVLLSSGDHHHIDTSLLLAYFPYFEKIKAGL
jgi:hypothetical protein